MKYVRIRTLKKIMRVRRVWKSEDHFVESGSLHQPLHEPQGSNSGFRFVQQAPLPAEPSA